MARTSKPSDKSRAQQADSERDLDEALEESFPASDPPAVTRTAAGAPDHAAAKKPGSGKPEAPKKK